MEKGNVVIHGVKSRCVPAVVVAVGACAMALAGSAMADTTLDVTGVVAGLTSATTGIGTVAAAMLLVAGAGIAIKWFLGFLFG